MAGLVGAFWALGTSHLEGTQMESRNGARSFGGRLLTTPVSVQWLFLHLSPSCCWLFPFEGHFREVP